MSNSFEMAQKELWAKRNQKGVLIGAHRGTSGGSIIQNTIPAYMNALRHGADVVEVDAAMTTDGDFFAFHDGAEEEVFHFKKNIRTMSTAEALSYPVYNALWQPMETVKINRLDDVLEALKGKCLINIDRTWFYWEEIIRCLNRHNMFDQLILKAHVDEQLLAVLEELGPKLMYMPIVKNQTDYRPEMETVWRHKVNVMAAEIIMVEPSSEAASRAIIEELHKRGSMAWINTLTLHDKVTLSMWRDDNKAVIDGPDEVWGWLMDLGFDIIQTDWPALLRDYLGTRRANG